MTPTHDPFDLHISEVRVRVADGRVGELIGWASCVVNDCLYLNNIRIRRVGEGEIVLTYPATRSLRGAKHFFFRPINAAAKEVLDRAILRAVYGVKRR